MDSMFGNPYVRESSLHFVYCTMKQVKSINENWVAEEKTLDDILRPASCYHENWYWWRNDIVSEKLRPLASHW